MFEESRWCYRTFDRVLHWIPSLNFVLPLHLMHRHCLRGFLQVNFGIGLNNVWRPDEWTKNFSRTALKRWVKCVQPPVKVAGHVDELDWWELAQPAIAEMLYGASGELVGIGSTFPWANALARWYIWLDVAPDASMALATTSQLRISVDIET